MLQRCSQPLVRQFSDTVWRGTPSWRMMRHATGCYQGNGTVRHMQAGKADLDKQPPPTQLVTLLMQTPQLYARNAVRTIVSVAAVTGCNSPAPSQDRTES
jgi:hypothetical protein